MKVCFTITGTDYNRVACEDIAAKFVTWSDDPLVTLILTIKLFTLFNTCYVSSLFCSFGICPVGDCTIGCTIDMHSVCWAGGCAMFEHT